MLSEKSPLNQLRFLTIRTLKTRYAGTALGAVWAFALPLMQIIIYIVVFGFLFKSKLPGSDKTLVYVIWFLLGYSPWMLFSDCLVSASSCMQANAGLIKSFPFKKSVIVYSSILSSLPQFLLCLLISLLLMLVTGVSLSFSALMYQAWDCRLDFDYCCSFAVSFIVGSGPARPARAASTAADDITVFSPIFFQRACCRAMSLLLYLTLIVAMT